MYSNSAGGVVVKEELTNIITFATLAFMNFVH